MIIGLTAYPPAGAGKSTVARYLTEEYSFREVSMADPFKRFCMEVFDWGPDVVWGPTGVKNKEDRRYPRGVAGVSERGVTISYLTPRYAMQRLGSEWGRDCYKNLWVNYCMKVCETVMFGQTRKTSLKYDYSRERGLYPWNEGPMEDINGMVIPDIRFDNEAEGVKEAGGVVWNIRRLGASGLPGDLGQHESEVGIRSGLIDATIDNDGSIEELHARVRAQMKEYE